MSGSNGWKYCPYCGNRLEEKDIKRSCSYAGTIDPFDQGRTHMHILYDALDCGWIPVNVSLPEKNTSVLITVGGKGKSIVETGAYTDVAGWIHPHMYTTGKVVAWQPLIKPYEEATE